MIAPVYVLTENVKHEDTQVLGVYEGLYAAKTAARRAAVEASFGIEGYEEWDENTQPGSDNVYFVTTDGDISFVVTKYKVQQTQ